MEGRVGSMNPEDFSSYLFERAKTPSQQDFAERFSGVFSDANDYT